MSNGQKRVWSIRAAAKRAGVLCVGHMTFLIHHLSPQPRLIRDPVLARKKINIRFHPDSCLSLNPEPTPVLVNLVFHLRVVKAVPHMKTTTFVRHVLINIP